METTPDYMTGASLSPRTTLVSSSGLVTIWTTGGQDLASVPSLPGSGLI